MKSNKSVVLIYLGVVTLFSIALSHSLSFAGEPNNPKTFRDSLMFAASEIIDSARICTMATIDELGQPRVRPMDPFPPEKDMTIWLGTNRRTRKVSDIRRNPSVSLCYLDPQWMGYVTIYGDARIVDDPEEMKHRWKPEWEQQFKNKDAEYILIEVKPRKMEVINYRLGIAGDPDTWLPPSVDFARENK